METWIARNNLAMFKERIAAERADPRAVNALAGRTARV